MECGNASRELLQFERGASALEKRLLLCTSGAGDVLPPTIGPVPESDVLGRIRAFLPNLREANCKLFSDIQTRGVEEFNIETIRDDDKQYIQMDLALGVADLHTPEALAAAELTAGGQVLGTNQLGNDLDSESEDEDFIDGCHTLSPIRASLKEPCISNTNGAHGTGAKRKRIVSL